jgi:hypothetical protein
MSLQSALHHRRASLADAPRAARKPGWYMGWIVADDDTHAIRCLVTDVTRAGARVKLFAAADIPHEFTLHFTRTGNASIRCHVDWRGDGEAGVEFVSEPPRARRPGEAAARAAIVVPSQVAGAAPPALMRLHA